MRILVKVVFDIKILPLVVSIFFKFFLSLNFAISCEEMLDLVILRLKTTAYH